jgi:hypothetical protein
MAKTRSAARMARLIRQWHTSGETASGFARRHEMSAWTFWYWRRKLSVLPVPAASPAAFVSVEVAVDDRPVLELVFVTGERLQVRTGASADLVRAAVGALRSPC